MGTTRLGTITGVLLGCLLAGGVAWWMLEAGPVRSGDVARDAEGVRTAAHGEPLPALSGTAPASDSPAPEEESAWTVRASGLLRPGTIGGRVTDERGRPLESVAATLEGPSIAPRTMPTAADGRFLHEELPAGTYALTLAWGSELLRRDVDAGGAHFEIVLRHDPTFPPGVRRAEAAPEGVLGGTVRDETGAALPGCVVGRSDESGRTLVETRTTNSSGQFRFEGLDEGRHGLGFRHPNAAYVFTYARASQWLSITLRAPARVAGIVVAEEDDRPIAGLQVAFAHPASPAHVRGSVSTGEDGAFSLPTGAGEWLLVAGDRDPSEFVRRTVGPVAAGTHDLRIRLRRGLAVVGGVRGLDGGAWTRGGTVRATPYRSDGSIESSHLRSTLVAPDGTFRLFGLLDAVHDISFTAPDINGDDLAVFGLVRAVRPGARGVVVDLREGRPLHVRLVDGRDRPLMLSGGWIYVRPWDAKAGGAEGVNATLRDDGRFATPALDPTRTYTVFAGGFPGYVNGQADNASPGDEILVRLDGLPFTGRVVDARGEPVPDLRVTAMATGGDSPPFSSASVTTDAEGRFAMPGAPRGRVEVTAAYDIVPMDLGEYETPASGVLLRVP
jgi:hypothetical protein